METRPNLKQRFSLRDRIEIWAATLRDRAAILPPGKKREILLKKVRAAEAASHLDRWVNSRDLRPPR